jgi:hypothetical protein
MKGNKTLITFIITLNVFAIVAAILLNTTHKFDSADGGHLNLVPTFLIGFLGVFPIASLIPGALFGLIQYKEYKYQLRFYRAWLISLLIIDCYWILMALFYFID